MARTNDDSQRFVAVSIHTPVRVRVGLGPCGNKFELIGGPPDQRFLVRNVQVLFLILYSWLLWSVVEMGW